MKSTVLLALIALIGAMNAYPQNRPTPAWGPAPPTVPIPGATTPTQNQPSAPNQPPPPFFTTAPNGLVTNANGMVPRLGAATNQFSVPTNQPGGLANEFVTTNGFDRDDLRFARTNLMGGLSNQVAAFTNGFGTNNLVPDVALTAQDRILGFELRRQLLPEIRETLSPIHLVIRNGVVTLVGSVPSPEDQQEIENIVRRTPGVVNLVDNLQISPTLGAASIHRDRAFTDRDRDLLGQVRSEMERHRRRDEGNESVHIHARNGVVTLFGFVNSDEERQRIEAATQGIPGVTQVIDRLRVDGQAGTNVLGVGPNLSPTSRTGAPSRIFPGTPNSR